MIRHTVSTITGIIFNILFMFGFLDFVLLAEFTLTELLMGYPVEIKLNKYNNKHNYEFVPSRMDDKSFCSL